MPISIFEMFRPGIGPSSSHTVGPMIAAARFAKELSSGGLSWTVSRVACDLMGSLGATGRGHATDKAVILGLMGADPQSLDPDAAKAAALAVHDTKRLKLAGGPEIAFDPEECISFSPGKVASYHTNALELSAFDERGGLLLRRRYYSVGGGFVVTADADDFDKPQKGQERKNRTVSLPHPYANATGLVEEARAHHRTIAEIVRENEEAVLGAGRPDEKLDFLWSVMQKSIERGLASRGTLPGPLKVRRRAPLCAKRLAGRALAEDPMTALDWVSAWAFAVAEENAAGGRIVTAPTNGAAGVIPAVLMYLMRFTKGADEFSTRDFLLTAGAVGILYKENASISGAEVGCQGEIGVACSMAAAGLAAALGGTVDQVENAAEIGMEHTLGLTCDPVRGQVQIPCIERNALAAVKAIEAARLALMGDGSHFVSLDQVMRTMFRTGRDMQSKYKETSLGGLAVCVVEC